MELKKKLQLTIVIILIFVAAPWLEDTLSCNSLFHLWTAHDRSIHIFKVNLQS